MESMRQKDTEKEKEKDRQTHTHTQTMTHRITHKSKRAHHRTHTLISQCPLKLEEVKSYAFIFIRLGCLEISHIPIPRAHAHHAPKISWCCSHASHPPLATSISLYPFVSFSFSTVLPLTFQQSLNLLLCLLCSQF